MPFISYIVDVISIDSATNIGTFKKEGPGLDGGALPALTCVRSGGSRSTLLGAGSAGRSFSEPWEDPKKASTLGLGQLWDIDLNINTDADIDLDVCRHIQKVDPP